MLNYYPYTEIVKLKRFIPLDNLSFLCHDNTKSKTYFKSDEWWCIDIRTTRDYEGPSVAPRVQAALDAAMNNVEEDIDIDALAISNTFEVKVNN